MGHYEERASRSDGRANPAYEVFGTGAMLYTGAYELGVAWK